MHRRQLILSGLAATAAGSTLGACASGPRPTSEPSYPISSDAQAPAYTAEELIAAGSRELGIAAEAMGGAIERIFAEQGDRPTAYIGGNASRVFTLVYGLYQPDALYRRYPGVEGSAYLIGGLGVNYQQADGIVLAPIRTGVGLRLGANVGTMAYSRQRNLLPF